MFVMLLWCALLTAFKGLLDKLLTSHMFDSLCQCEDDHWSINIYSVIEDLSSAPKFLSCETRLCPFHSSVLVDVRLLQIGKFVEVTRPNLDTKHLGFVRGMKILILKRTTKVWHSLIISSLQTNIRLRSVSSYINGVGMLMEDSKSLQAGLQMCRERVVLGRCQKSALDCSEVMNAKQKAICRRGNGDSFVKGRR
jgi:hypothetical protein